MPRYSFQIRDGAASPIQSLELKSLDEARSEAAQLTGRLLQKRSAKPWRNEEWLVVVKDESASTVFTLKISSESREDAEAASL